ncbi:MAG TPA: MXAN_2562 family outer membrane beta-barrel protein, partial [Kofleriaceae bacterium]|nr:MXAN_2562 family outer membrane beta-barrel protein [Kofleriaceae bacterium]
TNSDTPATSSPKAPRYQTPLMLCGAQQTITLMPSDITSGTDPDAGVTSVNLGELANLNPAFICGESTTSTATSLRIEGLKNGTAYTVVLLAIDKYGNSSGTYFTSRLTPVPATDFWEDIHDQGSKVEGGFCLISQTYGDDNPLTQALRRFRDDTLAATAFGRWLTGVYYDTIGALDLHGSLALRVVAAIVLAPLVVLALLWHLLTLPGLLGLAALGLFARRRREWRARLATAATAGVILLVPARAHAQAPYWENEPIGETEQELPPGDPLRVTWHAGIRVGPYVPGIDAQLDMPAGKYAGPYEQMFGGYSILPMLDVERFLWRGFGQLGVGVSVGYMGKSAHAWLAGSLPTDPNRPRAEGDTNKFRLFPFSVNAVYRLTYLDDELGIPVVPYGRVGLAYYVWWIDAPNGDFASACTSGGSDPMCTKTTAAGASMGLVGSVGLAIRAERIDISAARSMRESGIEHAGFYGEYSVGKVDGFGSDKKLSVGDATWFAGVDFEF